MKHNAEDAMSSRPASTLTPQPSKQQMLFIVGPTASGKSGLAMQVAQAFDGEIICADSQTIRRGMDIGTAKPSKQDQQDVSHWLLDIIEPYDRFSVAEFKKLANEAIQDILSRGKLPIVVGGTGLYIDAVLYDFTLRRDTGRYVRSELDLMSVDELQKIVTAEGYPMPANEQNPRHLIRTIESEGLAPGKRTIRDGAIVVGVDPGKDAVEARIRDRARGMLSAGFLSEVKGLLDLHGQPPRRFDAILYNIVCENPGLDGRALEDLFVIGDRRYAKKQRAWFRRSRDIVWFENPEAAYDYARKQISEL